MLFPLFQIIVTFLPFFFPTINKWLKEVMDVNELIVVIYGLETTIILIYLGVLHYIQSEERSSFKSELREIEKQEAKKRDKEAEQQRAFQERQAEEIKSFESKYITGVQTLGYCKSLEHHAFFSEHLVDYQTCKTGINTSWLHPSPPRKTNQESQHFFDEMIKTIDERSKIVQGRKPFFRRIILCNGRKISLGSNFYVNNSKVLTHFPLQLWKIQQL
jgi:hypothetical protein